MPRTSLLPSSQPVLLPAPPVDMCGDTRFTVDQTLGSPISDRNAGRHVHLHACRHACRDVRVDACMVVPSNQTSPPRLRQASPLLPACPCPTAASGILLLARPSLRPLGLGVPTLRGASGHPLLLAASPLASVWSAWASVALPP